MSAFAEPAFFALLAASFVPAVVLGCLQRSIRLYGFAASVVFVALALCPTPEGAAFLACFLALSFALHRWVLRLFRTEHPHAVGLYRVALALAVAPLVVYKVTDAFGSGFLGFLGISYMTFKSAQVLIETRDGLIDGMATLDYFYFLLFFPTYTSGPIMRSRDFCSDMASPPSRADYLDGLSYGLLRFVGGAVYKFVFAALFSWLMWFGPQALGTATPLAAAAGQVAQAVAYGLFLFFDFAGYSLMAIGAGAVFGCKVPRNFRLPFAAVDIKDFWNRWHMTLSFWLRDFVFMRLSRSLRKRKVFRTREATACAAYIANMALMGAWHGLTPDYLLYGLYHGLLLAGCELFQRKSGFYRAHKDARGFRLASWALNMVAVFFGFALFSGQVTTMVTGA